MSTSSPGFTLVEAVIGLTLVSLLTAGTAGLLVTASRAVTMARLSTTAMLLASQKVEQLRTDAVGGAGTFDDLVTADGSPAGTADLAFMRRWTLEPALGTTPGVMTVRVEVRHAGPGTLVVLHGLIGAIP